MKRELDAIDSALAGGEVEADLAELAELAEAVRETRPLPSHEVRERLDARAAELARAPDPAGIAARLRELWRSGPSYRALAPAGLAATVLVAAAVGIAQIGGQNGTDQAAPQIAVPASPETFSEDGTERLERDSSGEAALAPDAPVQSARGKAGSTSDFIAPVPPVPPPGGGGGVAGGVENRKQDRDVDMTLSTDPDEVRRVADEVVEVTKRYDGIVRSSQVITANGDLSPSASLQLVIPTAKLDDAVRDLTDLASVESLNERLTDITKPFISAREKLRDARAERERLLEQLKEAGTTDEVDVIRGKLRDVRRRISIHRAELQNVAQRANNADVNVSVVGNGEGAGPDDGTWGIDDAVDDALSVLRSIAGALIVALAAVIPLTLLFAAGWWATSAYTSRRRESALDGDD